jgi:hypothetical protein
MPDQSIQTRRNAQEYEVAEPQSYSAYPLDVAPKQRASVGTAGAEAPRGVPGAWDVKSVGDLGPGALSSVVRDDQSGLETSSPPASSVETRAVWVVHGMGQQIPFQTLDQLANGILQVLKQEKPPQCPKPRLRNVKIDGQVLQRVEIDVHREKGDYNLHLYETYWAPDTEGVAKLSDVMSFLWDGGTRGLLNCMKRFEFQRAMFGGMEGFTIPKSSAFYLCTTMLVLLALTVINGVIVSSAVAKAKIAQIPALTKHWHELAAVASVMVAVGFTLGIVLFLADSFKPETLSEARRRFISWIGWAAVIVTVLQILLSALVMTMIVHLDWISDHPYKADEWFF